MTNPFEPNCNDLDGSRNVRPENNRSRIRSSVAQSPQSLGNIMSRILNPRLVFRPIRCMQHFVKKRLQLHPVCQALYDSDGFSLCIRRITISVLQLTITNKLTRAQHSPAAIEDCNNHNGISINFSSGSLKMQLIPWWFEYSSD